MLHKSNPGLGLRDLTVARSLIGLGLFRSLRVACVVARRLRASPWGVPFARFWPCRMVRTGFLRIESILKNLCYAPLAARGETHDPLGADQNRAGKAHRRRVFAGYPE